MSAAVMTKMLTLTTVLETTMTSLEDDNHSATTVAALHHLSHPTSGVNPINSSQACKSTLVNTSLI